jgi:hypothetical protein
VPGLHADLASRLQALPRHPAGYSRRRSHTNAFEAFLDGRVENVLRCSGSSDSSSEHILGASVQRLAETTEILPRLIHRNGRGHRDFYLVFFQARALN